MKAPSPKAISQLKLPSCYLQRDHGVPSTENGLGTRARRPFVVGSYLSNKIPVLKRPVPRRTCVLGVLAEDSKGYNPWRGNLIRSRGSHDMQIKWWDWLMPSLPLIWERFFLAIGPGHGDDRKTHVVVWENAQTVVEHSSNKSRICHEMMLKLTLYQRKAGVALHGALAIWVQVAR